MRGKGLKLLFISVSLLALISLVFFCTAIIAQTPGPGQPARPVLQQKALNAIIGFSTLGMFYVVTFAVGVGVLAIQLWTRVTFPERSEAVLRATEGKRWKLFLVGLVNLSFLTLLFWFFCSFKGGVLGVLGVLVGMVMLASVFLGLLAKAERLGGRILSRAGRAPNPIASILVGWPVMYLVVIIPFLGWALFLYLAISGTGAVVLSFIAGRRTPATETEKTP